MLVSKIVDIARVCHEANRAWCIANDDFSQLQWAEAPQWQRDSAIKGVIHAICNPNAKPEDSHNNWMTEKLANGWVYGKVKDTEAKAHPCLIPFDQLPDWQQKKDALFLTIVRALA